MFVSRSNFVALNSLTYVSEHSNELNHSYNMNSLIFFLLMELLLKNLVFEIPFYKFCLRFLK